MPSALLLGLCSVPTQLRQETDEADRRTKEDDSQRRDDRGAQPAPPRHDRRLVEISSNSGRMRYRRFS